MALRNRILPPKRSYTQNMISSADRDKYTNTQLDEIYLGVSNLGTFTRQAKEQYERQVAAEQAAAKSALEVIQGINKTDVTMDVQKWPTSPDPSGYPRVYPYPEPASTTPGTTEGDRRNQSQNYIWDASNDNSVTARWFWDTRRYILSEAADYYNVYEISLENLSIVDQDILYFSGKMPEAQKEIYLEHVKQAYEIVDDIIDRKPLPPGAGGDIMKGRSFPVLDDKGHLIISDLGRSSDWATKDDPYYGPSIDRRLGLWMFITYRFTYKQAQEFAKYNQVIEHKIDEEEGNKSCSDKIVPWNYTPWDLVRVIEDYIICFAEGGKAYLENIRTWIEDVFGVVEDVVFYGAIVLVLAAGYAIYNDRSRNAIKSAVYTTSSYASNLIPGKQYYDLKKQVAESRGISVKQAIAEDVGQAYNPVGLIGKVTKEYTQENPDSFTAALVPQLNIPQIENSQVSSS